MAEGVDLTVDIIDPCSDAGWSDFVGAHCDGGMFHCAGWLAALRATYGYEPWAYVLRDGTGAICAGLPLCKVDSSITGKRLVSVPFADHCQPLVSSGEQLTGLLERVRADAEAERCRYVELRPLRSGTSEPAERFGESDEFLFHEIDLSPDLETIRAGFHASSIERKIRRSEREGLEYAEGNDERLLGDFYRMMVVTRRKHGLPPQPLSWFRNLLACMGDSVSIRLASKDGRAVAAILTCTAAGRYAYKYGCSDPRYTNFGGTAMLFWRAIQDAKESGASIVDLGRTDRSNEGLATFKKRWGADERVLRYYRSPAPVEGRSGDGVGMRIAKAIFARLPSPLLVASGRLLYRHMG